MNKKDEHINESKKWKSLTKDQRNLHPFCLLPPPSKHSAPSPSSDEDSRTEGAQDPTPGCPRAVEAPFGTSCSNILRRRLTGNPAREEKDFFEWICDSGGESAIPRWFLKEVCLCDSVSFFCCSVAFPSFSFSSWIEGTEDREDKSVRNQVE